MVQRCKKVDVETWPKQIESRGVESSWCPFSLFPDMIFVFCYSFLFTPLLRVISNSVEEKMFHGFAKNRLWVYYKATKGILKGFLFL